MCASSGRHPREALRALLNDSKPSLPSRRPRPPSVAAPGARPRLAGTLVVVDGGATRAGLSRRLRRDPADAQRHGEPPPQSPGRDVAPRDAVARARLARRRGPRGERDRLRAGVRRRDAARAGLAAHRLHGVLSRVAGARRRSRDGARDAARAARGRERRSDRGAPGVCDPERFTVGDVALVLSGRWSSRHPRAGGVGYHDGRHVDRDRDHRHGRVVVAPGPRRLHGGCSGQHVDELGGGERAAGRRRRRQRLHRRRARMGLRRPGDADEHSGGRRLAESRPRSERLRGSRHGGRGARGRDRQQRDRRDGHGVEGAHHAAPDRLGRDGRSARHRRHVVRGAGDPLRDADGRQRHQLLVRVDRHERAVRGGGRCGARGRDRGDGGGNGSRSTRWRPAS